MFPQKYKLNKWFIMGVILIIILLISLILYFILNKSIVNPKDNSSQLPNPASVYCEKQGGLSEIRTNIDNSQTGYCIFQNGSECEEWAFFRGECKK